MFWFLFVISLFLCSCLAAGCVRAQLMLRRVFNHRAYQLVATEKSVQSGDTAGGRNGTSMKHPVMWCYSDGARERFKFFHSLW